MTSNPTNTSRNQALLLLFGGLLPVVIFTVIEDQYGIQAGLVAGLLFGLLEITYELIRYKKVSTMTWVGNGLLLLMGVISLLSQDGIWFKMQPALLEFGFFIFLFMSWLFKKPFLKIMIEKQNPQAPEFLKNRLSGMTLRLSLFMLAHALIATYAAFYWSTEAWALLKGLGLTLSLLFYMLLEVLATRKQIQLIQKNKENK